MPSEPNTLAEEVLGAVAAKQAQPKVLIGYPCYGDVNVPKQFTQSLHALGVPPGTDVRQGDTGSTQAEVRESLAEKALQGGYSHLFQMDMDMVYPQRTLLSLMEADVDVICAFAVCRVPPHFPIFGPPNPDDPFIWQSRWPTDTGRTDGKLLYGVQPTGIVGGAGLLVKTSVFERLPKPWFSFNGRTLKDEVAGEDVWFSKVCRDNGIPLHCMTSTLIGHLIHVALTPDWEDLSEDGTGKWKLNPMGLMGPFYDGPRTPEDIVSDRTVGGE